MKREEQIRSAAFEASTKNDDYKKYAKDGIARMFFVEGAMFADANQPSPWISVEDRLPDRLPAKFANWSKEVFVAVKRGRECRAYVDNYSHIYKTWGVFGNEVTHWMPIPELPKEEKK